MTDKARAKTIDIEPSDVSSGSLSAWMAKPVRRSRSLRGQCGQVRCFHAGHAYADPPRGRELLAREPDYRIVLGRADGASTAQ
jgi:hypothetical protein